MPQQIDLENLALLIQRLGVPKSTVYQWQHGRGRPPWRLMPQIADALAVPLPDLVEALWREKAGDPCPCGCRGTKVFPIERPEARTLAIEIPCAKCGTKRIHKRWKTSRHRKLCPTCATTVERIEFTCVGYRDHDATRHARTCPGTLRLRPSDVSSRQWIKKCLPDSRFDVTNKTYQCNGCAGAERLHAWEEKELGKLYAKKYPHESTPKIQSGQRRLKMRHALHAEFHAKFSPNFKATREAQELGRLRFIQNVAAGKKYPKKTIANVRRHWLGDQLPKGINFGICIVCQKLIVTMNSSRAIRLTTKPFAYLLRR